MAEGVVFDEPKSAGQRHDVARACGNDLKSTIPCVVDTMDNKVDTLYAGWPERIFVIDRNGRVAYAGVPGPWGFKPKEAAGALRSTLRH